MTRVDFYILESGDDRARLGVACRLAEKAYGQGLRVYAHVPNDETARRLDEAMWTFRDGSFLPHAQVGQQLPAYRDPRSTDELPAPVLIGSHAEPPADHWDLLLNLDADVPSFFSRYHRLAELVGSDPAQRTQARERFRFYRDRGYELHTHRLARS